MNGTQDNPIPGGGKNILRPPGTDRPTDRPDVSAWWAATPLAYQHEPAPWLFYVDCLSVSFKHLSWIRVSKAIMLRATYLITYTKLVGGRQEEFPKQKVNAYHVMEVQRVALRVIDRVDGLVR